MWKTRPAPTAATVRPRQARDPGQAGVSASDVLRRGGPRAALPGAHPARPPQCVPHTPYSRARSGRACPAPAHVAPGSLAGAAFYLDIYFKSMWSSAVFVDYVKAWRWPGHNQDEVALGCDVEWRGWGACRRAYGGRGPGVAGAAGGGGAARVARGHARGAAGAGVRPGWDVGLCELFAYAELTAHVHWQPYRAPTLRRAGAALSAAQARACAVPMMLTPYSHVYMYCSHAHRCQRSGLLAHAGATLRAAWCGAGGRCSSPTGLLLVRDAC